MHFFPLPERPDYAQVESWAAHPHLEDPSDEKVADVQAFDAQYPQVHGKGIDVFFIHPTLYLKGDRWNADTQDSVYRQSVESSTIKLQASVFNALGNVWSPHYRQMLYRGYVPRPKDNPDHIAAAFDTAYADVLRAFHVFMKNREAPFVLAGHSQGTHHAVRLLREVIAVDSVWSKQMLVAFLVGGQVTLENTGGFPICQNPEDINCWVGWRTVARRHHLPAATNSDLLVNPMTMSVDRPTADREDYMGAYDGEKRITKVGIQSFVDRGTLHIYGMRLPYSLILRRRDYHRFDYNLFWFNVRHNLYTRRDSWIHGLRE